MSGVEYLGKLKWNIHKLSSALKIAPSEVEKYMKDGRKVSFICERRVAKEYFGIDETAPENSPYDFEDKSGLKWEVRSISKGGTYFSKSSNVGSGRRFSEQDYRDKLDLIEGYILCDIDKFPKIPVWRVTVSTIKKWDEDGELNADKKISRDKVLSLIEAELASPY